MENETIFKSKGLISHHNTKYINDRVEMPVVIDIKQLPAADDITACKH